MRSNHAPADGNANADSSSLDLLETDQQIQSAFIDIELEALASDPFNFGVEPSDYGSSDALELVEGLFRHGSWAAARRRVWLSLLCCASSSRRCRFANCGASAYVQFSANLSAYKLTGNYCRDRFCQPCQRLVQSTVRSNIVDRLRATREVVRFVTFTLRHSQTPLADQLNRLYRSFAELRRRVWWQKHVQGGYASLEVKVGKDGLWHPHLHCLVAGGYLDQHELSQEWLAVTGDSSIVDVRAVKDAGATVEYMTSYITKDGTSDLLQHETLLVEFAAAIKGRRRFLTFGSWRGLKLVAKPADTASDWSTVGSLRDILRAAAQGHPPAMAILLMLRRTLDPRGPVPPEDVLPPPPCDLEFDNEQNLPPD